jgi:cobalt-zinc-cadmium efflux system membrane fusion protein
MTAVRLARSMLIAGSFILVLSCRKAPSPTKEASGEHGGHDDDREGVEGHAMVAPTGAGVLRIDPGMIRDLRLKLATVESRPGGEGVTLPGELQPDQDAYAEVGTPVEGRVIRLTAAAGNTVKAGAPLAEVESVVLGQARAAETSARAKAELARQVAERKRQLVSENIAPGKELDEATAEAKAADAELQAARTTLRAYGTSVSGSSGARFLVRTPVSGTVLDRKAARGQVVTPDQTMFWIADLRTLWLTAHAFERDALRLKVDSPASVTFPALPGKAFTGKVAWVGSQVEVASRTIPVRVTVPNPEGLLRPGMSASAWLPFGSGDTAVIAVPTAAMQRLDRDWIVFVPRAESHTFEIRRVGRGRDLGGEVEILSGLRAGETVVVDGAFLLKAEAEKARGMGEQHEH